MYFLIIKFLPWNHEYDDEENSRDLKGYDSNTIHTMVVVGKRRE